MSIETQFDREMEMLDRDLADGLISGAEYTRAVNNLEREARQYLEEEAEQAYNNVMVRW